MAPIHSGFLGQGILQREAAPFPDPRPHRKVPFLRPSLTRIFWTKFERNSSVPLGVCSVNERGCNGWLFYYVQAIESVCIMLIVDGLHKMKAKQLRLEESVAPDLQGA
jgi:hypothetical protein